MSGTFNPKTLIAPVDPVSGYIGRSAISLLKGKRLNQLKKPELSVESLLLPTTEPLTESLTGSALK